MSRDRDIEKVRVNKIAAGIVVFNPENRNRLDNCIKSVLKQVHRVYVFDNSTIENRFDFSDDIVYITENNNKGIAHALNVIMESAEADGYNWVITMDQDSILPEGMVQSFEKEMCLGDERIAIICPQVIDKRRSYMEIKKEPRKEYIDDCITSASCTSIEAWKHVGRFDEWLFIDLVDNEFSKRLILSEYKILRLNDWILDQEFGKIEPKGERSQKFWIKLSKILRNQNVAKFSYRKHVSPMRVYYTHRNIIYVNKKMMNYGKVAYQNYNCKGYIGFLISFAAPSLLRAQDKVKVLRATICGIRDGIKVKTKPWKVNK